MDYSIIINSKRPFEEFGHQCVEEIIAFDRPEKYEIIFGHNTNIIKKYRNTRFINYGECSSVESLNMMSSIAKGNLLIYLNDAVSIGSSKTQNNLFFEYLNLMQKYLSSLPKLQISSLPCGPDPCNLPTSIYSSITQERLNVPRSRGQICRFPIVTRKTLEKEFNGKIFNPSFIHHYVDNWIGFYCELLGQPMIEHCPNHFFLLTNNSKKRLETRKTDSDDEDARVLIELLKNFNHSDPEYAKKI